MIKRLVELLDEKGVVFYRREISNGAVFAIPYVLVKYKRSVEIKIVIDDEHDYYVMGFECKKSGVQGSSDKLLDINAGLKEGVLAVEQESNLISFRVNLFEKENLDWDIYQKKLHYCLGLFIKLDREGLIDTESYKVEESDEEDSH